MSNYGHWPLTSGCKKPTCFNNPAYYMIEVKRSDLLNGKNNYALQFDRQIQEVLIRKWFIKEAQTQNGTGEVWYLTADNMIFQNYINAKHQQVATLPPFINTNKHVPIFVQNNGSHFREYDQNYYLKIGDGTDNDRFLENLTIVNSSGNVPQFDSIYITFEIRSIPDPALVNTSNNWAVHRLVGGI